MAENSLNSNSQHAQFSADSCREGLTKLSLRLSELSAYVEREIDQDDRKSLDRLHGVISHSLTEVFGADTIERERFTLQKFAYRLYTEWNLDPESEIRPVVNITINDGSAVFLPENKIQQGYLASVKDGIALLTEAVAYLERRQSECLAEPAVSTESAPRQQAILSSKDVIVIHGRDTLARPAVERVLKLAGLNPIVLHEQPNGGQTLIRQLEKFGIAGGFAVVVATPDDVGGVSRKDLRPRAKQNVIGEMFWFAGRLGRERVFVLLQGDTEMPSDIAGIGYTAMDNRGAWKTALCDAMQDAGYSIDRVRALG